MGYCRNCGRTTTGMCDICTVQPGDELGQLMPTPGELFTPAQRMTAGEWLLHHTIRLFVLCVLGVYRLAPWAFDWLDRNTERKHR